MGCPQQATVSWPEQASGRDRAGLLELRDTQVEWQGQTSEPHLCIRSWLQHFKPVPNYEESGTVFTSCKEVTTLVFLWQMTRYPEPGGWCYLICETWKLCLFCLLQGCWGDQTHSRLRMCFVNSKELKLQWWNSWCHLIHIWVTCDLGIVLKSVPKERSHMSN